MTVEEIFKIKTVSSPQISPDGRLIAVTVSEADWDENRMNADIYLVNIGTGKIIRLTYHPKSDLRPRWSPDGNRIAFISSRPSFKDKSDRANSQIWVINPAGGEPYQLTNFKTDVIDFRWSPDGRFIAFIAKDTLTTEEEMKRKKKDDAIVVDVDVKHNSLWLFDVEKRKIVKKLTDGITVSNFSWSPDGRFISAVVQKSPVAEYSTYSRILIISLDDTSKRELIPGETGNFNPKWSPDGKRIAFINSFGMKRGDILRQSRLFIIDVDGRNKRNLTPLDFKGDVNDFNWSPDGKAIYLEATYRLYRHLYKVNVNLKNPKFERITNGDAYYSSFSFSKDGKIVAFLKEDVHSPRDVYVASVEKFKERKLTDFNPQIRELKLASVEIHRWKSFDDMEIEGLVYKPVNFKEDRRYPTIVWPHGGPASAYHWNFRPEAHMWAGLGYVVLMPNVRGSDSYGEEFLRANYNDLGGGDFKDMMTGVDYLIEIGLADPDKLLIKGWSYGGYMTAWAVTQTDRFKAAIAGAAVTNWFSCYSTDDIQYDIEEYFNGHPWEDDNVMKLIHERSPVYHVKKVKTPVLILHGEKDIRDPYGQALEFYMGLKKVGVEVQLVMYPREPHSLRELRHRKDRLERSIRWFRRYIK
jgi:dipeptidyl aminopeptidase/acylaminoacyl peptidase